jgi:hypothetical protein
MFVDYIILVVWCFSYLFCELVLNVSKLIYVFRFFSQDVTKACFLLIFPEPVTLNRFLALDLVFILGIFPSVLIYSYLFLAVNFWLTALNYNFFLRSNEHHSLSF